MFELTFPADVQELVTQKYRDASSILEYGSGGSTVLAAAGGVPCLSVETDESWASRLRAHLVAAYPDHKVSIRYQDIGPVGKWGRPVKYSYLRLPQYLEYSAAAWTAERINPDLVLIDGRFRLGCFINALLWSRRDVTILFDDYLSRPLYHAVERYLRPTRLVGRMAVFEFSIEDRPRINFVQRIRMSRWSD